MKRLARVLVPVVFTVLMFSSAYATDLTNFCARGSAVVTGMHTSYSSSTVYDVSNIWITNVAGAAVSCRVTVYDHDGQDVTSLCSIYTGGNAGSSELVASGTGSFELPAGSTRLFKFYGKNSSKVIHGHAVIEWASEDTTIRKALIAVVGRRLQRNSAGWGMFQVNNGQPF